jgi:hypothetical protein
MTPIKLLRAALAIALGVALLSPSQGGAAGQHGSPLWLLNGSYAAIFSGWLITNDGQQPFAGTGIVIADGDGHLTGTETVNLSGVACDYKLSGTYTIAGDGTGTDALSFTNGSPGGCQSGSFTQSLVVAGDGDLVLLSNTNFPDVATEHWYRVKRP